MLTAVLFLEVHSTLKLNIVDISREYGNKVGRLCYGQSVPYV